MRQFICVLVALLVVTMAAQAVNPPPTIGTQPASQTLLGGTATNYVTVYASGSSYTNVAVVTNVIARFNVTATNATGYRWYQNGTLIAGQTASNLLVAAVATNNGATFQVVATNSSFSVTSSVATLTVVLPTFAFAQDFSSAASGWSNSVWSLTGTGCFWDYDTTWYAPMPKRLMLCTYSANKVGNAWFNASTVNPATNWTFSWSMQLAYIPAFYSSGAGMGLLLQGDGTSDVVSGDSTTAVGNRGITGPYVSIFFDTHQDSGDVSGSSLKIDWGSAGSSQTNRVTYDLTSAGNFGSLANSFGGSSDLYYGWPYNATASYNAGNNILTVTVANDSLASGVQGATNNPLVFTVTNVNLTATFAGKPAWIGFNALTDSTANDHSLLNASGQFQYMPPSITQQPVSVLANGYASATFTVVATSQVPPAYQWQLNGTNITGATNYSYTVASAVNAMAGSYTVAVSNPAGSVTSAAAVLTVKSYLASSPASAVVGLGQPASLSVTVGGIGATIQWFKDGVRLIGQTNATLSFSSFGLTNSGSYAVVLNSSQGLVISLPALLSLPNAPLLAWGYNAYGQLGNGTTAGTNRPVTVASNVVAVATGGSHSLFVKADGTLWAMGYNGSGELGNGTHTDENSPVQVSSNVVAASAGDDHSLFVKSDGTLWTMGDNTFGQLGTGTTTIWSTSPIQVASNVVAVAAGAAHSLFVKNDGTLWAMGENTFSPLVNGALQENSPVQVSSNVVAVAAGAAHSLFVKADGTLWAVGDNSYGELGNGTTLSTDRPVPVASNVVAVAAGYQHSLFVKSDGTLWAMGYNAYGQLGNGTTTQQTSPIQVASNVVAVSGGAYHSLFVKCDGTLSAMGDNYYGELGIGSFGNQKSPVPVPGLIVGSLGTMNEASGSLVVGARAPQVASLINQTFTVGQSATFTLSVTNGSGPFTYQWQFNGTNIAGATNSSYTIASADLTAVGTYGSTAYGMIGSASSSASLTVYISPPGLSARPVGGVIAAGSATSLSVTATGDNVSYQWLKDGAMLVGQTNATLAFSSFGITNSGSYTVVVINPGGIVISLPALLSLPNAPLLAWGYNIDGQLGNGTNAQQNSPIQVASNAVVVAAGLSHSLFVKSDGTLWAMGDNGFGDLGIGTITQQTSPIQVASNVVAVAAGESDSLFVKNDGTLWTMGDNRFGQLGIGNTTSQTSPIQVASNVVAVAAGDSDSLFVKNDGTLWAMGDNGYGQLGIGNTTSQTSPVQVAINVVAVAAGRSHSLFVKSDGTLWAMGDNGNGELGIGSIDSDWHSTPEVVASNVVAVAAGLSHSLFVKSDGTLWTMGKNSDGQLGIGSIDSSRVYGHGTPGVVASNVVAVAAGDTHSLFVKSDGTLWGMGYNGDGQLGLGNINNWWTDQASPVQVPGMIVGSAGAMDRASHSLAVGGILPAVAPLVSQTLQAGQSATYTLNVTNGSGPFTYQWQFNGTNIAGATNVSFTVASAVLTAAGTYTGSAYGMVGSASRSATLTVNPPPISLSVQPVGGVVAAGRDTHLSVTATGDNVSYQWLKDGAMLVGQTNATLAFSSFGITNSGSYQMVVSNPQGLVISLPALLSLPNAPLEAWGYNSHGQLGNGATGSIHQPMSVDSNVVAVTAGLIHSLFVKIDGTLWAVGNNGNGQLGNGDTDGTNILSPQCVASNVVAVAAGCAHSLFVKSDGTLWAMGNNVYGQLGNGDTDGTNVLSPQCVASNVVAVAAGSYHSLFVKSDGTLWAMGHNTYGDLGNGTIGNTNRPVQVSSNVVAVAAGFGHSLFVKNNGTLWAMGNNIAGQLGNGAILNIKVPVSVASNVVAVAAGYYHSLFVKSDRTLWAMGTNGQGQLGNGTTVSTKVPVKVGSNVVAVAAGQIYSLFVKNDGALWAMGYNGDGELGNGTTINTKLPVQVPGLIVGSLGAMDQAFHSLAVAYYSMPPAAATVTLSALSQTYDGSAHSPTANTTPGGLAVSYTYNGFTNAPVNAGSYTVVATVTSSGYIGGTTNTLVISPAAQSISLQPLSSSIPLNQFTNPIPLVATASSGLTVNFSVDAGSAATLTSSNTLANIGSTGIITVRANQAGNSNYLASAEVVQIMDVTLVNQTITFGTLADQLATAAPLTLGATASSSLPILYTVVSGPATVIGNTLTLTGAGQVIVAANQAGDSTYNAAATVNQGFAVFVVAQSILFDALPQTVYGDAPFTLTATASSGLAVSFMSSDSTVVRVAGNTATVNSPGTLTITAAQAGNAFYGAATNVTQTLTVEDLVVDLAIGYDGATQAVLTVYGNTNRLYNVLRLDDLMRTNWQTWMVISNLPSASYQVTDPTTNTARFYRLQRPIWTPDN